MPPCSTRPSPSPQQGEGQQTDGAHAKYALRRARGPRLWSTGGGLLTLLALVILVDGAIAYEKSGKP